MNKNLFSATSEGMQVFFGFENANQVFDEYAASETERAGIEFIYALNDGEGYEGWSSVIFIKDGVLYEVNGSHCSCYGLEGQWRPEETSFKALMFRPNVSDDAKKNLKKVYPNLAVFL